MFNKRIEKMYFFQEIFAHFCELFKFINFERYILCNELNDHEVKKGEKLRINSEYLEVIEFILYLQTVMRETRNKEFHIFSKTCFFILRKMFLNY